jgi:hypothetical protein
MSTSGSESRSAIVVELAEEFLDRQRAGQRPPLKEYIDRHPELAGEIREVSPAQALTGRGWQGYRTGGAGLPHGHSAPQETGGGVCGSGSEVSGSAISVPRRESPTLSGELREP